MSTFAGWLGSVEGQVLNVDGVDSGQCSQVALSWGENVYPGVPWPQLFPPTPDAKNFFTVCNTHYWTPIANDHNDPNQVPLQGDVMVFDSTPQAGYSDGYNNPYGHVGVCYGANNGGYTLVQQNAPNFGAPVNVTTYPWRFRPCIGWLRPLGAVSVPNYYTVQSGDTVSGICEKENVANSTAANDWAGFRQLNPQISNISLIYPGEHVRVS